MQLTILGCHGPYAGHGDACSGYLLRGLDNHSLMLDCGSGVLSQLPDTYPMDKLDGLILSHLHPDHCADAFTLPHMLQFADWNPEHNALPLLLPDGPENLASYFFTNRWYEAMAFDEYQEFIIKHWHIICIPVRHSVPTYAVRVWHEAEPNVTFVYTGDTNTHPPLVQLCKNADFLLADAMFLLKDWSEDLPHMSASHAAGLASFAKVKRLMLTHLRPGVDPTQHLIEAGKLFLNVEHARPRLFINVSSL
ncbi:MAG: MBL fold metallo-hydrolase [Oscillospiraceae bacterium]|jgi:ribonuclease BN (tRNA processing enzyme)|nr:MBL fold metallo-hydrolase [Oscillospiraceae bacterium]